MKTALKIILALAVIGVIFYAFQVAKERYGIWQDDSPSEIRKNGPSSLTEKIPEEESQEESPASPDDPSKNLKTITASDCDNECRGFSEGEALDYCEQICGISDLYEKSYESEENGPVDCEKRNGLERDYCFKDLAIEEGDFEICDEVKDDGIRKTCRDRITEDLMENQTEE